MLLNIHVIDNHKNMEYEFNEHNSTIDTTEFEMVDHHFPYFLVANRLRVCTSIGVLAN